MSIPNFHPKSLMLYFGHNWALAQDPEPKPNKGNGRSGSHSSDDLLSGGLSKLSVALREIPKRAIEVSINIYPQGVRPLSWIVNLLLISFPPPVVLGSLRKKELGPLFTLSSS